MPNPADKKYENKKSLFVSDCIRTRMKEGDEQKQAIAVCINIWEEFKKKSDAHASLDGNDEILFFDETKDNL